MPGRGGGSCLPGPQRDTRRRGRAGQKSCRGSAATARTTDRWGRKEQTVTVSAFWRLKVLDQGASRALSSWHGNSLLAWLFLVHHVEKQREHQDRDREKERHTQTGRERQREGERDRGRETQRGRERQRERGREREKAKGTGRGRDTFLLPLPLRALIPSRGLTCMTSSNPSYLPNPYTPPLNLVEATNLSRL